MKFSPDQQHAVTAIMDWISSDTPDHFFVLAGYAGTGKTTLIAHIRELLEKDRPLFRVAFCSYTGKATQVMKSKLSALEAVYGTDEISTIHSLIYSPVRNDEYEVIGWEKADTLAADLIIVDEASMLSEEIWDDLLSYKIPILAVGDHGQLPPIRGNFNLMQVPTVKLEKIHRQAEAHPIIHLSQLAREEGYIPIGQHGVGVRKIQKGSKQSQMVVANTLRHFHDQMLLLCGYNSTRVKLNVATRKLTGKKDPIPTEADQVICLKNNHDEGIFNGMVGTIKNIVDHNQDWYQAMIDFPERDPYLGLIYKHQFNQQKTIPFEEMVELTDDGDLFDFGYAMTVHKAQGSQAREVLLFEERFPAMDDENWRRWLYTAITRAEEKITIIGR